MRTTEKQNSTEHTKTYTAKIDGGHCGETTIKAGSAAEALVEAIDWAKDGDWPDGGCEIQVGVQNDADPDDCASDTVEIQSAVARRDEELARDGEVIAENEGEYSTEIIVVMDGTAYYMHPNGGSRGSYDRRCGDGVWRNHPCDPTREISQSEARCLMLDWGYNPKYVAKKTKGL